jgi:hypothetical protein
MLLGLLGSMSACGERSAQAERQTLTNEPSTSTYKAQPGTAAASAAPALGQDDNDLRRGYGIVDMRYDSCVTADTEYVLRGKACKSGYIIYGPYVAVPSNAQIEVSFEAQTDKAVEIYADVATQMGKLVLAGLSPQVLDVGVKKRLGYFVHVAAADVNVESRVGFRTNEPVELLISNLTMTVR